MHDRTLTMREKQLTYLKKVLAQTGWSQTDLAVRSGLDPSTLSRFMSGGRADHALRDYTMVRIQQATGVTVEGTPEAAQGFSDREATPLVLSDETPGRAAIQALIGDQPTVDAWTLTSRALENAGCRPGDTLIVNLSEKPTPGDIVCAQIYDWNAARAETVFRIFQPPALLSATGDPSLLRPYLLDDNSVKIKGVVLNILRTRRPNTYDV